MARMSVAVLTVFVGSGPRWENARKATGGKKHVTTFSNRVVEILGVCEKGGLRKGERG